VKNSWDWKKECFLKLKNLIERKRLEEIKLLVDKQGFNENGLKNGMKEALKTFKLHGKILI